MTATSEIPPTGTKIRYHGGWDGTKTERCPICNFQCGYVDSGEIIERYQIFSFESKTFVDHPDLWVVKLDNGAFVVGYPGQIEPV